MRYEVSGLAPGGAVSVLEIEAPTEADARREAEASGLAVFRARAAQRGAPALLLGRRPAFAVLPFTHELLTLLRAGLSLVSALEAVAEKERHPASREVIGALLLRLRRGGRLSEAMEESAAGFPQILVAGVRASERTGNLDEALQRYADYARRMDEVKKKLAAAMIYPALLLTVGLLVSVFLIAYVVPKFASVYRETGGDLPWASALLLEFGRALAAHPGEAAGAALAALAALAFAVSRPEVRAWAGERVRAFPGVGPRIRVYEIARLYRTLAMLLRGGTPIVPALGLAATMLSGALRPRLAAAAREISQGAPISRALDGHGLTTPVGNRMLGVGERGGGMADMLERIADYHDDETARWVDWASRLFEPVMMALLGVLIGGIVVLLYMPIFDLAGAVK